MAACVEDFCGELDHDEANIAVSLSEALQADEVEKFLVLYDTIPRNITTERVSFVVNFRYLLLSVAVAMQTCPLRVIFCPRVVLALHFEKQAAQVDVPSCPGGQIYASGEIITCDRDQWDDYAILLRHQRLQFYSVFPRVLHEITCWFYRVNVWSLLGPQQ